MTIKTERPHLFTPNANISICVRIVGNPGDEQLKSAISEAVRNNESLCSKVVIDNDGIAYYEKAEPRYEVNSGDEDWTKLTARFPAHPLDFFNGEMVRFHILRNGEELRLLIIGHHLAGDGLSFVFFAEDIIKALNGEALNYKPLRLLDTRKLPKETDMRLRERLYLRLLNGKWLKHKTVFNYENHRKLLESYSGKYSGIVFAHKLNGTQTNTLIRRAKAAGISVNNMLVTAFLKAHGREASVGIPVSVREPDECGMANWVSGIKKSMCYNGEANFLANAGVVQKDIYGLLSDNRKKYFVLRFLALMDGSFLDSACMVKYLGFADPLSVKLAALMSYTQGQRDLGITNLSRVSIQTAGKYSVKDIAFVPPVVPYCKRTIGVVTYGHAMYLTMNTIDEDKDAEWHLFSRAVECIQDVSVAEQ